MHPCAKLSRFSTVNCRICFKRGQAHRRRNKDRISHSYPARQTNLQAIGIAGLYPVGEGMGYGGGIASAALDGIRSAEALLQALGAAPKR